MDPRAERRGASRAAFEVVLMAGLAGVYFVLARVGLGIHAVGGFATLVWPPSGISLAALLVFGPRLWPGVAAGAFLANLATGAPPLVALGIAAGNVGEPLFAVWALRRIVGFRPSSTGSRTRSDSSCSAASRRRSSARPPASRASGSAASSRPAPSPRPGGRGGSATRSRSSSSRRSC